jgi:c-di-GMP-binding flagellar brake protein YcgR
MGDEQRVYKRVEFGIEDGFIGVLTFRTDEKLTAMIVNLSGGGLRLAVTKDDTQRITIGDILFLERIIGAANLEFLSNIIAEIRWIKDIGLDGYFAAGCEFQKMHDQTRGQLIRFVETERKFRGQYD